MKLPHPTMLLTTLLTILILLTAGGCDETPEETGQRLVELARESMAEQRKQNEHIARQSQAVIEESHQLAETAKELVQNDAEARRELIAAQEQVNTQLHQERTSVNAQRDQLEAERKQIADQRHRDPLIAAAIQNTGLIIAWLLPLIVCIFVIRQMRNPQSDDGAVAELLIHELVADHPRLLPDPSLRPIAIPHQPIAEPDDSASASGDADDDNPPF